MGQLALILTAGFAVLTRNTLYCALIVGLLALTWASSTLKPRKQKYAAAPIICVDEGGLEMARERFRTDARSMLREGYENYKGRPFYVPSPLGERLMIPSRYVEELKTAPVKDVDFVGTFYEVRLFEHCPNKVEDSKGSRCSRENTLLWEVDRLCIPELPSSS